MSEEQEQQRQPRERQLRINTDSEGWNHTRSAYANQAYLQSDLSPETLTLTFLQVVIPEPAIVHATPQDGSVDTYANVVSRIVMPRSKLKELVDNIQRDYEVWFGDES